jgi:hypothetical protein
LKISIKMPTTTDAFNQAVLAQLATVEEQRFCFGKSTKHSRAPLLN